MIGASTPTRSRGRQFIWPTLAVVGSERFDSLSRMFNSPPLHETAHYTIRHAYIFHAAPQQHMHYLIRHCIGPRETRLSTISAGLTLIVGLQRLTTLNCTVNFSLNVLRILPPTMNLHVVPSRFQILGCTLCSLVSVYTGWSAQSVMHKRFRWR